MAKSNMIYSYNEFKNLILSKAQIESYYLLYDDFYFEQIDKNTNLLRDTFSTAGRYSKSFNIVKYMNFAVKENYSTKELHQFITSEKPYNKILLTIYDSKNSDCFMLFISNKDDSKLERKVKILLEKEK